MIIQLLVIHYLLYKSGPSRVEIKPRLRLTSWKVEIIVRKKLHNKFKIIDEKKKFDFVKGNENFKLCKIW